MTSAAWALLAATLIVSIAGFAVTVVMSSRGLVGAADQQHVTLIATALDVARKDIEKLEARVEECELGRQVLARKNEDLLHRQRELEAEELRLRRRIDTLEAAR